MANRCAKIRYEREERERKHVICREQVEREHQVRLEDWEKKMMKWKEKTDALEKQRTRAVERVRQFL